MWHSNQSPPIAHLLYKSSTVKQKNIKDILKGGSIKETMGCLISKFFIYESIAPQKAKSHHFKNMIIDAQQVGFELLYCFRLLVSIVFCDMLYIFVNMNYKNGNWISISIWNKEQVLGNGVQKNESIYESTKRKIKDIWVHNNVRWIDRAHTIKYY